MPFPWDPAVLDSGQHRAARLVAVCAVIKPTMPSKRIEFRKAPYNLIDTQVIQAKGLKSRGVDDIRRLDRPMIETPDGGRGFARAQRTGLFMCMSRGLGKTRDEPSREQDRR